MRRKIMIIGVVAWLALPGVLAAQMQGGGMHGGSGGMMSGQGMSQGGMTGWMGGWAGGGMWLWTVVGILVVVLLVVVISKQSKK